LFVSEWADDTPLLGRLGTRYHRLLFDQVERGSKPLSKSESVGILMEEVERVLQRPANFHRRQ